MKKAILTTFLLTVGIIAFAQNEYQAQLYSLNDRLISLEKKYLAKKIADDKFHLDKFELIKDYHRLGEEAGLAGINKTLDSELSDLISSTTEIACNRLNFLEYYLVYDKNKELYKINIDRSKTIYLSLYLKVKALEKIN
jgi:hypothetical protein